MTDVTARFVDERLDGTFGTRARVDLRLSTNDSNVCIIMIWAFPIRSRACRIGESLVNML
jgi:hypothetical protein